ncbi:MAG: hypothetical protein ACK4GQ_01210, partial [Candidatus Hadarchaeales archaeon]
LFDERMKKDKIMEILDDWNFWKKDIDVGELRNLRYFLKKFGIKNGYVAYLGKDEKKIELGDKVVKCIPLISLCLFGQEIFSSPNRLEA